MEHKVEHTKLPSGKHKPKLPIGLPSGKHGKNRKLQAMVYNRTYNKLLYIRNHIANELGIEKLSIAMLLDGMIRQEFERITS